MKAVKKTNSSDSIVALLKTMTAKQNAAIEELGNALTVGDVQRITDALKTIEGYGSRNAVIIRFANIFLGQTFLYLKEKWDTLPVSFTSAYDGFYDYIHEVYGIGGQMADMYSGVWDAFFSGKYLTMNQIPKYVQLKLLSVARLYEAVPYIKNKEMTVRRWQTLANRSIGRTELRQKLSKTVNKPNVDIKMKVNEGPKVVFIQRTGDIRLYQKKGGIEQVGFLNVNSANPTVLRIVREILKDSHIKVVK